MTGIVYFYLKYVQLLRMSWDKIPLKIMKMKTDSFENVFVLFWGKSLISYSNITLYTFLFVK